LKKIPKGNFENTRIGEFLREIPIPQANLPLISNIAVLEMYNLLRKVTISQIFHHNRLISNCLGETNSYFGYCTCTSSLIKPSKPDFSVFQFLNRQTQIVYIAHSKYLLRKTGGIDSIQQISVLNPRKFLDFTIL